MPVMTIAAAQFTSGNDVDANLRRMMDLIDAGAEAKADLVVFQEFCNHPAWYSSPDHVWQGAISEEGSFLSSLRDKARERRVYVSFNATVRGPWPKVFDRNFLLSADGEIVLTSTKHILMGIEADFFEPGRDEPDVVDTEFGRIGLMSCMEGLTPETARILAVKGADLILNSLSSNGLDEAHTHVPVRAAENGFYVAAANRSGPLVDAHDLDGLAKAKSFDKSKLIGGGESQIVAPDGRSLVRAKAFVDDMVVATIDTSRRRPEALNGRRPECYSLLIADTETLAALTQGRVEQPGRIVAATAPFDPNFGGREALEAVLAWIGQSGADLIVLPELFGWTGSDAKASPDPAFTDQVIEALLPVAQARGCHFVAGVAGRRPDGRPTNSALLVSPTAPPTFYHQVHVHADDARWAAAGDEFVTVDLPFGRLGLLVGHDLAFPEAARILALQGADIIACPTSWRHEWESRLIAPERAAENHVSLVLAARGDSPSRAPSLIVVPPSEYRFPLTGEVNMPDRHHGSAPGAGLAVEIDLAPGRDKRLMARTDLLRHRQPELYRALTDPTLVTR